ncbi:MAG: hypothetical protein ACLQU4_12050 [Limisphaerales bacterium]
MNDIIRRKPREGAILKNMAPARQQALWEYMEGDKDEKGHSYKECIAWLEQDGIHTNKPRLSLWRDWYYSGLSLQRSAEVALRWVAEDKAAGKITTLEEELEAGQRFFSRLAMLQEDNSGFARIMTATMRKKAVKVTEHKLKLLQSREAKARKVIKSTKLTPDEKEARVKQILGIS